MKKRDLLLIQLGAEVKESRRHRHNDLTERYNREIRSIRVLNRQEEFELAMLAKAGDAAAKQLLVYHNLRSIFKIANGKKTRLFLDDSLVYEDLFNFGVEGLMAATKLFDPERGIKFISYAVNWTRARIQEHLLSSSRVRIKDPSYRKLVKAYANNKRKLWEQTGVQPLVDEVSERMGVELDNVIDIHNTHLAIQSPLNLYDYADTHQNGVAEYPTLGEDDSWKEFAESEDIQALLWQRVEKLIESEDTVRIIRYRFGFDDERHKEMPYREIGELLGIKEGSVKRRLIAALERLRGDPVLIELSGGNPWTDEEVWLGSSNKPKPPDYVAIERRVARLAQEEEQREVLIASRAVQLMKAEAEESKRILKSSRMDEVAVNDVDVAAFVQAYLTYHGYKGRNPFFPPKAPDWLITHLRGPLVHLLIERGAEMWEMEKALGDTPSEILLMERHKAQKVLRTNPDYLKELRVWLDEHLTTK